MSAPAVPPAIPLRAVTVRPTCSEAERQRWDALMAAHHYLPYRGLVGRALRHVAEYDGQWLALVGWQAGAFKLGARERWIGWHPAQQFRRLHLIANNARFLILPQARTPNLASRVLGLSLRRLSADWRALSGCPALLAETFVDPSRFTGACYRAANWRSVGFTSGYARRPGAAPRWEHHGQPKEVFMYELKKGATAELRALEEGAEWREQGGGRMPSATQWHSLHDFLQRLPDCRAKRGIRYPASTLLAIVIMAKMAGYRGGVAIGEFAAKLEQDTLRDLRAFYSHRLGRFTAPSANTFLNFLRQLPADTLERTLRDWAALQAARCEAVAMDGKHGRGASRRRVQKGEDPLILFAAVTHGEGLTLGQKEVAEKSNEIPAMQALVAELDLAGKVVTADALHTQVKTAQALLDQDADYVLVAKDNQPVLHEDLVQVDWEKPDCRATEHHQREKGHGRIENRRGRTVDLQGPQWDGFVALPGRRQGLRLKRSRKEVQSGKVSHETVYAVTSLGPEQADAKRLMDLVRGHWTIENKLHHVRDGSYDEDRCRVAAGQLPHNLASLTNVAIALIRRQGRFRSIAEANRHYGAAIPETAAVLLQAR